MTTKRASPTSVGPTVRELRLARGLTQGQLAEEVGIANETLSRIETMRLPSLSLDLAGRFAEALRVPVADLFREPAELKPSSLRPAERALLALVRPLDEPVAQDLVRALRLLLQVARHATTTDSAPPRRYPRATRARRK